MWQYYPTTIQIYSDSDCLLIAESFLRKVVELTQLMQDKSLGRKKLKNLEIDVFHAVREALIFERTHLMMVLRMVGRASVAVFAGCLSAGDFRIAERKFLPWPILLLQLR